MNDENSNKKLISGVFVKTKTSKFRHKAVLLAATSAAAVITVHANAQEGDEIIVTATKRATNLQDTALAVSAITEEFLQQQGFDDISEIAGSIPGLQFQNSGKPGLNRVTVRGISPIAGAVTVAYYLDELAITAPVAPETQADVVLLDVSRVEVLRGPQGTLYGEGAMGGAIRFITNKPDSEEFSARVSGGAGFIKDGGGVYETSAVVNVPLVEGVAAIRGVGFWQRNGGFIDNPIHGEDVNDYNKYGGRLTLGLTPTDALEINIVGEYNKNEIGFDSRILSPLDATTPEAFEDEDYFRTGLTAIYEFPTFTLTSATGYFERSSFGEAGDSIGNTFTIDGVFTTTFEHDVFQQELRAASTHDGPLNWVLGAFYKDQESTVDNATEDVVSFSILLNENIKQWAVFGELGYALTDQLSILGGVRYQEEEIESLRDFEFFGADRQEDENTFDVTTYKASLRYDFNEKALAYFTYSTGWRRGGVNLPFAGLPPLTPEEETFDPDRLNNYEIGWRTSWLDGDLLVNGAAYYNVWRDFQAILTLGGVTQNAEKAVSYGVEMEITANILDNLQVLLTGNVGDATIESDDIAGIPPGTNLQQVPDWQYSANISYSHPFANGLEGFANASWQVSGSRFDLVPNDAPSALGLPNLLDSFQIVNLNAGLRKDNWRVQLYAQNLFDEDVTFFRDIGAFSGQLIRTVNQPRTVGVRVTLDF